MTSKSFRDLEHAGWMDRAAAYDDYLARLTTQAIDPILDSFGDLRGKRVLDIACGPGHLAGAAARRGAGAEGLDFAAAMVAKAASNYAGLTFREGDAECLPYGDGCFDCAGCAFGLLHLEHPERAMSEAFRVLRPGGRYTFTVWCEPCQGGVFGLVLGSVQAHGTVDVGLPPAPPFFRFAEPEECHKALTAAGFEAPRVSTISLTWYGRRPQDVLELIYKSGVRAAMILEAQAAEARDRIHAAILTSAERYRVGERIEIATPALLVTTIRQ
jgi:SAM-dependent methyltransferase